MRVPGQLGVVEVGERAIGLFFEHKMTTYAAARKGCARRDPWVMRAV